MKAAAVPLALVPALGAVQGGFQPDAWVWAGALAAWAAAVAALAWSDGIELRRRWPWPAAAAGLLLWTLLSATWSLRPAQSALEARRTLVYAAVILALALLARSTRTLALATLAATAGLVLYALLRYLFTARHRDPFELYDLSQPLGYANAVGILAALAVLLALGVAAAERGALRRAGAAVVPPLALALTLSASDASWLALGAGLAVATVLLPSPQRFLAALAVLAMPTAALVVLGRTSRIAADVPSPRIGGAVLAAAAIAGAAVAAAAVPLADRTHERTFRHRRLLAAGLVVLALAGAGAVGLAGSTEPRASYWSVAWHDYTRHPLLGSGAGTFGFVWARSGKVESRGGALDAHSLFLETLAELGPLGLALVCAMLGVPFGAAVRRRGVPYTAAAAGAYSAFVLHAGLDWDWELPAVVVAGLACGGAMLAAEPGASAARLSAPARAALVAAALALAAGAIVGSRSHTVPGTTRAPQRGALVPSVVSSSQRYLP